MTIRNALKSNRGKRRNRYLFWGIFFLAFGVFMFMNGYYYADLGHNIRWFNCEYDTQLEDVALGGWVMDDSQMYRFGMVQMRYSLILVGASMFLFGRVWSWHSQ